MTTLPLQNETEPTSPRPRRADWAPFELVFFDCDSTLVSIEGIDELARWVGCEEEVAALTTQAMNGDLPLEAVYSRRLEMLRPTREHLRRLGQLYREHLIPGADQVIAALRSQGREVFIISGGLAQAVQEFGVFLGLPIPNIHAVEMDFNQLTGRWWETWKHPGGRNPDERYLTHTTGPLTVGKGKAEIIRAIRQSHRGRALLVGDGLSDLEAGEAVDLFVGFGGVVARERVRAGAEVFIDAPSLAPILPLVLAQPSIPADYKLRYQEGVRLIQEGKVLFQNPLVREGLLKRLNES